MFPSERVDIYGKSATEVQLALKIIITSSSVVLSVLRLLAVCCKTRTWTQRVDTGKLASDEAIAAGGDNTLVDL